MIYSLANARLTCDDGRNYGRLQNKPVQSARFGWSGQLVALFQFRDLAKVYFRMP